MKNINNIRAIAAPPVNEKEILRYALCKNADEEVKKLLVSCLDEALPALTYRVVFRRLPLTIKGDICDLSDVSFRSSKLAANMSGSKEAVVFAATIGTAMDRLISRYSRLSPARAVMLQAIGAERIEALCDAFERAFEEENEIALTQRFSPGYGDLSLDCQKEICRLLESEKRIGVCLNESLLMSPSKSVTAIAGICSGASEPHADKCLKCSKYDCEYRKK